MDAVLYFSEEPTFDPAPKAPPFIISLRADANVPIQVRHSVAGLGHGFTSTVPSGNAAVRFGGQNHTSGRWINILLIWMGFFLSDLYTYKEINGQSKAFKQAFVKCEI